MLLRSARVDGGPPSVRYWLSGCRRLSRKSRTSLLAGLALVCWCGRKVGANVLEWCRLEVGLSGARPEGSRFSLPCMTATLTRWRAPQLHWTNRQALAT